MKFKTAYSEIEANQWFKNGDHPQDDVMRPFEDTGKIPEEPREGQVVRYFRHPQVSGNRSCDFCHDIMHNHGWIDDSEGHIVCPGDWIITTKTGGRYPCKPAFFNFAYQPKE